MYFRREFVAALERGFGSELDALEGLDLFAIELETFGNAENADIWTGNAYYRPRMLMQLQRRAADSASLGNWLEVEYCPFLDALDNGFREALEKDAFPGRDVWILDRSSDEYRAVMLNQLFSAVTALSI